MGHCRALPLALARLSCEQCVRFFLHMCNTCKEINNSCRKLVLQLYMYVFHMCGPLVVTGFSSAVRKQYDGQRCVASEVRRVVVCTRAAIPQQKGIDFLRIYIHLYLSRRGKV